MPQRPATNEPLGLFLGRPVPRLYDRVVEVLRVRHDSRRTEDAYVRWIRQYIEFQDHRQLAEGDVNGFLTHLAVKEHVAASTQTQALSAILFSLRARPEAAARPHPGGGVGAAFAA